MKVTVSLGFRLLRRFERISLACGVSGVWAALFSDRGYVFWLCGPWGAWAGKYLVPPQEITYPHRGYFGLFTFWPCAWWTVVGPCVDEVGEGTSLPFRAPIRPFSLNPLFSHTTLSLVLGR